MLERFKYIPRNSGQALRAALLALVSLVTGCDDKVDWRGVSADGKDGGQPADSHPAQGDSTHDQT